ncbi:MAG: hypothetical protein EOO09_19645 [Chitinophagaceae bacterium]|nr:MAG: hypothetical protein EOO09_19645 [Chitinophagaceae bacterium]
MRNKSLRLVPLAVLLLTLCSTRSFSQSITSGNGKYEIGVGIGPTFFLGDLGGNAGTGKGFVKDVNFPLTRLSFGLHANYYPTEFLGFRFALNKATLEGNDAETPNKGGAEVDRLQRNLSFRTSVIEAYAAAEFYPTVFFEQYDGLQGKFRPYGVAGIGLMKFNPKAKDIDGSWVALQPLHLEGQGMAEYPESKPYKLMQMEVPMGIGFKYYLKENMYVGMEVLHRVLFTDHVDDVSADHYIDESLFAQYLPAAQAAQAQRLYYRGTYSSTGTAINVQNLQRGDPTDNDAFFSTVLRFGWRLNDRNDPGIRARRQLRCPVFY